MRIMKYKSITRFFLFLLIAFYLSPAIHAYSISSKEKVNLELKELCALSNDLDSIILYYIDFNTETPRSITRLDFVKYSIYGSQMIDYKKTLCKTDSIAFNNFFAQLNALKCDSVMPYDAQHVVCKLFGGKHGIVLSREEVGGDLRCLAILYKHEKIELIWFTKIYAFIRNGRFKISNQTRDFIDQLCKQ